MPSEKDIVVEARKSFVAMIKDENFYQEQWSRWSLKQHWSGAKGGFADEQLQKRWRDYLAGWKAATENGNNSHAKH